MPTPDRQSGMALWTHAKEFADAAKQLAPAPGPMPSVATDACYYLAAHAIELGLKGYLRAKGFELRELKDIGHNLGDALMRASACGLMTKVSLTPADLEAVALIDGYYRAKELEYRVTGFVRYPDVHVLLSVLEKLLSGVKADCVASVT